MPVERAVAVAMATALIMGSRVAASEAPPAFAVCRACHATTMTGPKKIGPHLQGIVGRKAASVADYRFSPAMKNSGIRWTVAELDAFLAAPRQHVPNTSMTYAGMKDPTARKNLIAYLATLK